MAQKSTTPTTHPAPVRTIRDRPPGWPERCYFEGFPKPCAYGILCHFGHEGDVYTDAPGVVQQFEDGYNVAALADAIKRGPRRFPPRGGLNSVCARGRGHRRARRGRGRSAAATSGESGDIAAPTGPPNEKEESWVADSAGLRGHDAGPPEKDSVASTNFPRRDERGLPATRGGRGGGPAPGPLSNSTPGTEAKGGQNGGPMRNLPSQRVKRGPNIDLQKQQPPQPQGGTGFPLPRRPQKGGIDNREVLPAPPKQNRQYHRPPPPKLFRGQPPPPLHQQLLPPFVFHTPPLPPQFMQSQQPSSHHHPFSPLRFHLPPPPPPAPPRAAPPPPSQVIFPGLPIGSSPYFSQTTPHTAPGVIFAAASGLMFYYGVDSALYAYDPAWYADYAHRYS